MKKFVTVLFVVIIIILAVFLLQNLTKTELIFLIFTFEISKALILIFSFAVGLILGALGIFIIKK